MSAPPPPEGASPSSQLEAAFQASSDFVRALPKDAKEASQAEKLRAYGFYKQATEGDCTLSRPGMMNFVRHVDQQLDTNSNRAPSATPRAASSTRIQTAPRAPRPEQR
jgi:acyl-CoA-binding protein